MKLVTHESGKRLRLGVVENEFVVDVEAALGRFAKGKVSNPKLAQAVSTLRKVVSMILGMP